MPREHPLAGVERELKVGPRRRLDLIEEVDADVRALQGELERRGRTPDEALEEALRQLVPAEDALEQLEARHGSRLQRRILAARWLDLAVRLGVGAAATLAGLAAITIAEPGPEGPSATLVWSQVILIALLAANAAWAGARLWIHGDLRSGERRLLWTRHGGLIVAAVALAALGAAWEGYSAFAATDPGTISSLFAWAVVQKVAHVAAIGLATAIFGLFGWLAITPRMITDEEVERRIARFFARGRPPLTLQPTKPPVHQPNGGSTCP